MRRPQSKGDRRWELSHAHTYQDDHRGAAAAAPVAASADIVTIEMIGLSHEDGATIAALASFKYDGGLYTRGPDYDLPAFLASNPALIRASMTVGDTPFYYFGPTASYDLKAMGATVTATRFGATGEGRRRTRSSSPC